MMMPLIYSFPCLAFYLSASSAFLFPATTRLASYKPELSLLTDAKTGTVLNIRLDVGQQGESRMSVNGLLINLRSDPVVKNYGNPVMPGANGPNPHTSSGVRQLNVLQPGHFVGMNGVNHLDMIHGCWEIVWRDGAAAGVLVCGMELTQEYRRNNAALSKGPLYLSFPLWTREGLDGKQQYKRHYEELAKEFKAEYSQEVEKMEATDNLMMKAWHFRNAHAAEDKHSLIPHREMAQIPEDHELFSLDERLLLSNKGLVWTREGSHQRWSECPRSAWTASGVGADLSGLRP